MSLAAVLGYARSKLGYMESPAGSNRNMFSTYWGHPAEPWCADFICWALAMGGSLDVPMSAYTPTLYQNYANTGRSGRTPRIGAVVFFQWPGDAVIGHVGVVESVRSDGSIVTIEGNTSGAQGGNGGEVWRQVRASYIAGYGYPRYGATPTPAPVTHVTRMLFLRSPYMQGADVMAVQRKVGAVADGWYGPNTASKVKTWQGAHGLVADGICGPLTLAKMMLL